MIAVDTNVLIYAHREESDLHDAAARRLVQLAEGEEPWCLPVFCIAEFLRVVTHRRVFNPPSTTVAAMEFIEQLLKSPSCTVAHPEGEFLDRFKTVLFESDARGNLIFDAQIAAICREQGISRILTNDRDFERFRGLRILPFG